MRVSEHVTGDEVDDGFEVSFGSIALGLARIAAQASARRQRKRASAERGWRWGYGGGVASVICMVFSYPIENMWPLCLPIERYLGDNMPDK